MGGPNHRITSRARISTCLCDWRPHKHVLYAYAFLRASTYGHEVMPAMMHHAACQLPDAADTGRYHRMLYDSP
jgi:hypothetical protein